MDDNINVNSADAIFIPSDIKGDRTDYTEYKSKIFRVAPENCVLVKQSKFNGAIRMARPIRGIFTGEAKMGGFHITIPFLTKTILVPLIDRNIDYPKAEYYTKDNIAANVDIVLKVRIVNPELYMREGRYQLKNLNDLTQSLLRKYISKKMFSELATGRIYIREFDPATPGQNGGNAEGAYEDFEKKYGIKIQSIHLKSIKLPDSLQKLYDDKIEEERKREAQRVRLEAEKERTEAEANMAAIRGRGSAEEYRLKEQAKSEMLIDRLGQLSEILTKKGMSKSDVADVMRMITAGTAGAAVIVGSNSNGNGLAESVAAGNIASDRIRQQRQDNLSSTNMTNVEKLIHELKMQIQMGLIEKSEATDKLERYLSTDSAAAKYINNLNETSYSYFAERTLAPYRVKSKKMK